MINVENELTIKSNTNRQAGFSFIELLISMAIFGLIMLGLNSLLGASNKVTQGQGNAAYATMAARKSLLRITDIVSQAHYIYPSGQVISLELSTGGTKEMVTGENALAILLPEGTTYCPGNGQSYCGYIISVEDRTMFESFLANSKHASNSILVGWRAFNLTWFKETVPSTALNTWDDVKIELLVDSVVPHDENNPNGTNLASFDHLFVSRTNTTFDNENLFSNYSENKNQPNSLIASIEPRVVIAYGNNGGSKKVIRESHIYARAIPRVSLPNPN